MALPAIGVAMLATLVFLLAAGTAWLFAARALSGLAIGMASAAASAWVVDLTQHRKERRGAAFTTGAIFGGLAIAALVGGFSRAVRIAPLKLHFAVYFLLLATLAFFVARTKDTVENRAERLNDVSR